jgi:hypothetical protein
MRRSLRLLAPAALLSALACGNAGEELGFGLPGNGALQAQFFVDRDWNGVFNVGDTTITGLQVHLVSANALDTVATGVTNANGAVVFPGLLPGPYTVRIDSAQVLGDSFVVTMVPARATVGNGGTAPTILVRLGFPQVTAAAARTSPAGRRVIVLTELLAGPGTFKDTTAHVRDTTAALRLTRVTLQGGGPLLPGYIVRVLGRVASRAGQPVLDSTQMVLLALSTAPPAPDTVTTAEAATAKGGTLDANLVRVANAEVLSSVGQGGDVVVTLDDGSGPLEMRIDSLLQATPGFFTPGDSITALGVLVSKGAGGWEFRLRSAQDLTIF